ncbi:hypothetical protein E2C01_028845 [Portunus trituberculatus]|uniref:Uncharacterized protein n=1 Tax=Portunus trituberculatus TaxID=210409 RepID=A0A5B7ER53_PORTR|nr:hypothetical protein [Portunus trituberculatus]
MDVPPGNVSGAGEAVMGRAGRGGDSHCVMHTQRRGEHHAKGVMAAECKELKAPPRPASHKKGTGYRKPILSSIPEQLPLRAALQWGRDGGAMVWRGEAGQWPAASGYTIPGRRGWRLPAWRRGFGGGGGGVSDEGGQG